MIKLLSFLTVMYSGHLFSQNDICKILDTGVFELYEKDKKIGSVYRKNGLQIEIYKNETDSTIARYKKIGKCSYSITNYKISIDLDTITWEVKYDSINKNEFSFEAHPAFIDLNGYFYNGKIKKKSNHIKKEKILKKFDELQNK